MAIRFDVPDDRVYLVDTLPAPGATGLTVLGWWRLRVDTNTFTTYYRTSGPDGTPTIHTCAADAAGQGINVFTVSGEVNSGYTNAVDEWVAIAVVDNGAGVSLYVRPFAGSTSSASGVVGSGTPAEIWLGGRALADNHEPLNGNAAYVRVFADALTQAEVEAEWDSATAVLPAWADWPLVGDIQDSSGNARHLTAVAGVPTFEAGPDLGGAVESPDEPPRVTVGATPVLLTPPDTGRVGRRLYVRNTSSAALALGGDDTVTAGTGFLLDGGDHLELPLSAGEELWAVRGGASDVVVHVLRLGD